MDTLIVSTELGLRPLGYSLVKIKELCRWAELESLPYDFNKIFSGYPPGTWDFVQAKSLFTLMGTWCTQHLIGARAQTQSGGAVLPGTDEGDVDPSRIADDPDLASWWVQANSHTAFELLFYEAVRDKKLRVLDAISRFPLKDLPSKAQERFEALSRGENGGSNDHRAKPEDIISALFDPVKIEVLEKMFPANGKWVGWAERASTNGLKFARSQHGKYNPYLAALWFLNQGLSGWDMARLNRVLANNLPARSKDEAIFWQAI